MIFIIFWTFKEKTEHWIHFKQSLRLVSSAQFSRSSCPSSQASSLFSRLLFSPTWCCWVGAVGILMPKLDSCWAVNSWTTIHGSHVICLWAQFLPEGLKNITPSHQFPHLPPTIEPEAAKPSARHAFPSSAWPRVCMSTVLGSRAEASIDGDSSVAVTEHGHKLLWPVWALNMEYPVAARTRLCSLEYRHRKRMEGDLWDSDGVMKPCVSQEVLLSLRTPIKGKDCPTDLFSSTCRESSRNGKQGQHGLAQLEADLSFAQQ